MSELILTDLHKRFADHTVLAGLDLTVPSGSFAALLGPSGAGKTTLLRLLSGFDAPDRGTIAVGGRIVSGEDIELPPEQRRIGYVPQEGSLFPHLTVAANVGFGLPRKRRPARVKEMLDLVGMSGLDRRYPHQLSGGQQQRIALARALAIEPEVVLLDEPFAALDANLRSDLREEVRRILKLAGTTTLLVTHNQDEALSTADLVAVLRDGRIIQQATPHELYTHPVDDELASFVGAANLIEGVLEPSTAAGDREGFVLTALGRLPAHWRDELPPEHGAVTALIRPEQITVAKANEGTGSVGRVIRRGFHGHDTVLHIQVGQDQRTQPLLVRTLGNPALAPGDSCTLLANGTVLVWPTNAAALDRIPG
jgi:iron(III) transport system ATP-binding protein